MPAHPVEFWSSLFFHWLAQHASCSELSCFCFHITKLLQHDDIYICLGTVTHGWDDPPLSILHKDIVAAILHGCLCRCNDAVHTNIDVKFQHLICFNCIFRLVNKCRWISRIAVPYAERQRHNWKMKCHKRTFDCHFFHTCVQLSSCTLTRYDPTTHAGPMLLIMKN